MTFNFNSLLKIFILLILSGSSHFLSAQYEDLQKDENITWIAEFSNDHSFALNTSSVEAKIKLLKFEADAADFSDENSSSWVTTWIYNYAKTGRDNCYKNKDLTQPISKKELTGLISNSDTIVSFDSDTYEEMIQITKDDLSVKDIHGLRVNQIIFYDQKRKSLNTRIIAVAPLAFNQASRNLNLKQKKDQLAPLFWIKMDGKLPKKFKVTSSDINWAALVFSKTNSIDLNSIKTVKIMNGFDIKNRIYQQAFEFEKPIVNSFDGKVKLTKEELNSIYTSRDTVVTFSPDTYEQVVQITENKISAEEISNIKLTQEWYYDGKRNRLMNQVKTICPIKKVTDKKGKLKYWIPLYFIKYE
jgi:hypothetical protein